MAPGDALALAPWPLLLAGGSILVVALFFRHRYDVFKDLGLGRAELALLCLGPLAGLSVNVPLHQQGSGLLAINLGGALLPVLLVALWTKRARLEPLTALAGTLLVAGVAKLIVRFDPELGIYTTFPQLFAPSLVALAYAMAVSVRRPLRAIPLAYTAGSMGALLGADLFNLAPILEHLGSADRPSVVSIGGAGVFDMVYLAGMVAMAGALLLAALLLPRQAGAGAGAPLLAAYPAPLPPPGDPAAAWRRFEALRAPSPLERARAALALSDLHLLRHDHARALDHAFLAVQALLGGDPALLERVRRDAPPRLRADLEALLAAQRDRARLGHLRRAAGNANHAAKQMVQALDAMRAPAPAPAPALAPGPGPEEAPP